MKKNIYISPAIQIVHVSTTTIVATSLKVDSTTTTTTQYTKENSSEWGNIWDEEE